MKLWLMFLMVFMGISVEVGAEEGTNRVEDADSKKYPYRDPSKVIVYCRPNYKLDKPLVVDYITYTNINFLRIDSIYGKLVAIVFHSKGIVRVRVSSLPREIYDKLRKVCDELPPQHTLKPKAKT